MNLLNKKPQHVKVNCLHTSSKVIEACSPNDPNQLISKCPSSKRRPQQKCQRPMTTYLSRCLTSNLPENTITKRYIYSGHISLPMRRKSISNIKHKVLRIGNSLREGKAAIVVRCQLWVSVVNSVQLHH
jgi:hypothetical protein